jgi:hypothetical protein
MKNKKLNTMLSIRVNEDLFDGFKKRADVFGRTHASVMRELMNEFSKGNLRILRDTKKKPGEMYVDRK